MTLSKKKLAWKAAIVFLIIVLWSTFHAKLDVGFLEWTESSTDRPFIVLIFAIQFFPAFIASCLPKITGKRVAQVLFLSFVFILLLQFMFGGGLAIVYMSAWTLTSAVVSIALIALWVPTLKKIKLKLEGWKIGNNPDNNNNLR
ncbi:MAG: hypothetical protein MJA83_15780 [Gammaproteobacteria bacterium]|nr:hypothetical protein [Gammaproteobacteria bacterium]